MGSEVLARLSVVLVICTDLAYEHASGCEF
jgi:hypothetical protein